MMQRLAATMPVIMEHTREHVAVKGSELIEQGHTKIAEGYANEKAVDPEKKYVQTLPVLMARNHLNRIKGAYKAHGRNGVTAYVNEVKAVITQNVN